MVVERWRAFVRPKERPSMSTLNGLPAHILLVHFVVVLVPLTAVLTIACALWPAARRRFVWLNLALAVVVLVLTPITTEAGEWLERRVGANSDLRTHTHLGDTFLYFAVALLVAAGLVAVVHLRASRERGLSRPVVGAVAVVAIAASVAATVQIYRIGESGAGSAWHGVATRPAHARAATQGVTSPR
jgi:uncharacterized membrane protein